MIFLKFHILLKSLKVLEFLCVSSLKVLETDSRKKRAKPVCNNAWGTGKAKGQGRIKAYASEAVASGPDCRGHNLKNKIKTLKY